ncbi:MAG: DUF551 domain-containing protein [Escherichia coli]|nr:DUF551 domain-containing protein [Escherichia coli]
MSTIAREFTKEQLQQIIETDHVQCGEASELARIALASLEAEPVCVIDQSNLDYLKSGSDADVWTASRTEMGDVLLYRALDYLQGHKDGLEWAAQLAEANHPQTGDWLYDDQIDLARAIRKGPDMPTVQGGSSPVTPDGWISCSERMPEKNQNVLISVNFDSSLVEPLICSARYTGSTFRRGDATIKPGNGIEQATHWMPLPEPPQEVNRG